MLGRGWGAGGTEGEGAAVVILHNVHVCDVDTP